MHTYPDKMEKTNIYVKYVHVKSEKGTELKSISSLSALVSYTPLEFIESKRSGSNSYNSMITPRRLAFSGDNGERIEIGYRDYRELLGKYNHTEERKESIDKLIELVSNILPS